jgi:hypothetical protein
VMTSPAAGSNPGGLSRAELLALIRSKLGRVVLYPEVSEQIEKLKTLKTLKGATNADQEYQTVFHADLINALLTGNITNHFPPQSPQSGWSATVEGVGCDGWPIIVNVEVSEGTDPLVITSFVIPQP